MSHKTLSRTDDWTLKYPSQDVRGWPVKDVSQRNTMGTVDQMIIDTDEERVDTLVLDSGSKLPVAQVELGDGVVLLGDDVMPEQVRVYDDGELEATLPIVVDKSTLADFRQHCVNTYEVDESAYPRYDSSYRYGYAMGQHDDYQDTSFDDASPRLRSDFEGRFSDSSYDDHRDAVRYGYNYERTRT